MRDATNNKSQESSKQIHLSHEKKQTQRALATVENAPNCDGTETETLDVETFQGSSHAFLLDLKETKENFMKPKRIQSPCFEDAQMFDVKYDKNIPIEVETSLFSDESFHTDCCEIFSDKENFGSVECEDEIDAATMERYKMAGICLPSFDSLIDCDEAIEILLEPSRIHSTYLEGFQKSNSNYDKPYVMVAATSIFSEHFEHTNFTEVFFENAYDETLDHKAAFVPKISDKCENVMIPFHPQESVVTPGNKGTKYLHESMNKHAPYVQKLQMSIFKNNNEYEPTLRATSSMLSEPCAHTYFNKVESENHHHGSVEYLEQFLFMTAEDGMELDIPIQIEDDILDREERIEILSDSIMGHPSYRGEFQKSKSKAEL